MFFGQFRLLTVRHVMFMLCKVHEATTVLIIATVFIIVAAASVTDIHPLSVSISDLLSVLVNNSR